MPVSVVVGDAIGDAVSVVFGDAVGGEVPVR